MFKNDNIIAVPHRVAPDTRLRRFGHEGGVVWLTGLSGAGKSTLAMGLEERLLALGYACYTLDGDNVRLGLNADLGFSPGDRAENIRRVGEMAALFADAGLICITAFISPYRQDRLLARQAALRTRFDEVYVAAELAVCEERDPKGLFRKARAGELRNFTGINAPYEPPLAAELRIDTGSEAADESLGTLLSYVTTRYPISGSCIWQVPGSAGVLNFNFDGEIV